MRCLFLVSAMMLSTSAHAEPAPLAPFDPQAVAPYACNLAERISLGPTTCRLREIAQTHRIVGELVRQGHCDRALKTARGAGDPDYADRIRDLCAHPASAVGAPAPVASTAADTSERSGGSW
jgi:hypothetical protein